MHYDKAIKLENLNNVDKESVKIRNHIRQCRAGIARTSIKNGDHRKGVSFAYVLLQKRFSNFFAILF